VFGPADNGVYSDHNTVERVDTVHQFPLDIAPGALPGDLRKACMQFGFAELFTPQGYNPKTKKGRARGYSTAILHLAPADLSGLNVCQYATKGCKAACLNTSGHGGIGLTTSDTNIVQEARIARTLTFRHHRADFNALFIRSADSHIRRAHKNGLTPTIRPNGTSDLPWERLKVGPNGETIFELYPTVQFYDYTKSVKRAIAWARGEMPANYHLTFSRAESNHDDADAVLAAGGNVAVVFNVCDCTKTCHCPLPADFNGTRVVDGDLDDLRFLDEPGVIVGLRAKGRANQDTSGFVVQMKPAPVVCATAAGTCSTDPFYDTRKYRSFADSPMGHAAARTRKARAAA
jgi:hypothetical protein